jgi:hypothetical protein
MTKLFFNTSSGNNIGVKRSYNAMSTKKSGGSGTTGGSAPSGVIAGTSQRNKKQRVINYMLTQSTISQLNFCIFS